MITVRLAASTDCAEAQRLFSDIRKNIDADEDKRVHVVIYRGSMLESDWAIHLHHDTVGCPSGRTWLGITLADEIRRIALVDHSIWIEET